MLSRVNVKQFVMALAVMIGVTTACMPLEPGPSASATSIATSSTDLSATPVGSPDLLTPTSIPEIESTPTGIRVFNQFNLEVVNQFFGATKTVAVDDGLAYLGIGLRVAIIDILDGTNPTLVSYSPILPGVVEAILVQDTKAYVGSGTFIAILDITDPGTVQMVGEIELPGTIRRLILVNDVLIAGVNIPSDTASEESETSMVVAVELSRVEEPRILSRETISQTIDGMAVANDHVYLGDASSETIYTINLSDPTNLGNPQALEGFVTEESSFPIGKQLETIGTQLIAAGDYYISVWDISDPLEPQKLWESELFRGTINGFTQQNGLIYVFAAYLNVDIYQTGVKAYTIPGQSESAAVVPSSTDMFVTDGQIFVANGGLRIFNVSDPENIARIGSYELPTIIDLSGVEDFGVVVGVREEGSVLFTISIPDLQVLGLYSDEKRCAQCASQLLKVESYDHIAHALAWEDGLRVVSLANPSSPFLSGTLSRLDDQAESGLLSFQDIAVVGSTGFGAALNLTAHYVDNELITLDFTDLNNPMILDATRLDGSPEHITADEQGVYVHTLKSSDVNTLHRFSVVDGELEASGSVELPTYANDLVLFTNYLVATTINGLSIIETTPTGELRMVSQLEIPSGLYELAIVESTAFATTAQFEGEGELLIIDLEDPTTPRIVDSVHLQGGRAELAVLDEYLLVGNANMGLLLLEIEAR